MATTHEAATATDLCFVDFNRLSAFEGFGILRHQTLTNELRHAIRGLVDDASSRCKCFAEMSHGMRVLR